MPGRLPPIAALRALEAAARHVSFTRAAHELNVTQSAISHQVKTLEELWGLKLFKRTVRGVALTPPGEELAKVTREFFERMTQTLDGLRISSSHERLRVDTLQSFAVKWLVPRLGRFHELHPAIGRVDLHARPARRLRHRRRRPGDTARRRELSGPARHPAHARGGLPGLHTRVHCARRASRTSSRSARLPAAAASGRTQPFPIGSNGFEAAGLPGCARARAPGFRTRTWRSRLRRTVWASLLPAPPTSPDELATGELVRLFDVACPSSVAYYLVCPEGREDEPRIAEFRTWIIGEAMSMQANAARAVRSA